MLNSRLTFSPILSMGGKNMYFYFIDCLGSLLHKLTTRYKYFYSLST